jgi:phosphoglycerol geranylgeranyltransferase
LLNNTSEKQLFFLFDPEEELTKDAALILEEKLTQFPVGAFLLGGSTLKSNFNEAYISLLKKFNTPIIGFPGSHQQVWEKLDGILFLSLLSGRNPQYLIEEQVKGAKKIHDLSIPTYSTAYLLIDGGKETSVNKVTATEGIKLNEEELFESTVLAAKYLGFEYLYLECGSGALQTVPEKWVTKAKALFEKTVLVGGGVRKAETANKLWQAGADCLVIGNGILENDTELSEIQGLKSTLTI